MMVLQVIWSFLSTPFSRYGSVKDKPDIQKEHAWYSKEFKPKAGVDYGIALRYAEGHYQEARDTWASLDRKATWLYSLIVAVVAAIYLMSGGQFSSLITWGLPALVFSGLAFLNIIRTKIPGERPVGMSIRGAIQCVESKENPSAIISANLHCATQELVKVNARKASLVVNASYALMVAFFLAPLVLIAPARTNPPFAPSEGVPLATSRLEVEPLVQSREERPVPKMQGTQDFQGQ